MSSSAQRSNGREVFAGYELVRQLGKGGMGEVFRAEKRGTKLRVALKRILASAIESPEHLHYFLGEMEIATQLQHANVVRVYDCGRDEPSGRYYLALELIEGLDVRSLRKLLAKKAKTEGPRYPGQERGVLPITVVAHIGIEAARGLSYVHGQKYAGGDRVIHRDISPDNIMLDIYGVVKINDFGIAKPIDEGADAATRTQALRGKARYASPEQCAGAEIGPPTDIYALGISLFELATGRHPYDDPEHPNELVEAKVYRAAKKQRPPIAELAPDMPPAMQELLERIIQPNSNARPQDAEELVAPLKRAIQQALEDSPSERTFDLDDIKAWSGRLVRRVYGAHTVAERPAFRPEDHESDELSSAPKSHERLRSQAPTKPSGPEPEALPVTEHGKPIERTAPLVTPATAPLAPSPGDPATGSSLAPQASSSRKTLIVALAISTLILIALLTGVAAFALSSLTERSTEPPVAAPEPSEPTEPEAALATPESLVAPSPAPTEPTTQVEAAAPPETPAPEPTPVSPPAAEQRTRPRERPQRTEVRPLPTEPAPQRDQRDDRRTPDISDIRF